MAKKKDDTTELQILEAAKKIFQAKGMAGARMQEIADAANINKAMLHYYYRNKQLLFEAVFKQAFALLAPQLNTILNDDTSVEEKVKNFSASYIPFIMKHPYLPSFVIQELNQNPNFIQNLPHETAPLQSTKFEARVKQEVDQGILKPICGKQLFINILALNMFPFLAKPLVKTFTSDTEASFNALMEQRQHAVSEFIISAIKK
ncbi:TetR/AcrR family transcriptional regulator [Bizionia sediminis]|uniref:TetR/AcrR family transcriptional regulator n=1 Tax=Bizionia sediminis TaxID=1737064 RepID=A0ABW5KPU7_9FLAO